jgi:L-lactate dehydrogenase complex protein LldG
VNTGAGITREAFLGRVRGELRKTRGLFPATSATRPADPVGAAEIVRRELAERWPQALERFRREFEAVAGVFHRVATMQDVPSLVGHIARERSASRLVSWSAPAMGADLAPALVLEGLSTTAMPDVAVDAREARRLREVSAAADIGLTGADLALAETGTLILRSDAGRPRSTSLLPPCHVAVFDRMALVETLQQVGVMLEAWHATDAVAGVVNFITGPSRTADIELTLTRGVHCPKEVHEIFVEGGRA